MTPDAQKIIQLLNAIGTLKNSNRQKHDGCECLT